MALTESNYQLVNEKIPDFSLPDTVSGDKALSKRLNMRDLLSDKATVVMFICNHCPFVKHILPVLMSVSKKYQAKGVNFVAISANDIEKFPADAPDKMRELAIEHDFGFPYLFDENQTVAKAFGAQCTPEFFIVNSESICVYHGQFDGSTPGNNIPLTGESLTNALDAVLAGKPVDPNQKPSVGCNIKWKEL